MQLKTFCPYQVGDIYLTTAANDPTALWPGTSWQALQDCVLMMAGTTYAAGDTGGSAEHTITVDEMPSHNHDHNIKATTPKLTHSVTQPAFNTPKLTHSITQPVFKYTAPTSHQHPLSGAGGAVFTFEDNGKTDLRLFRRDSSVTVAASQYTTKRYYSGSTLGSAQENPTRTTALCGKTDSAACSGTANGTECSRTTSVGVGDHAAAACTRAANVGVGDHAAADCTMSGSISTSGGGLAFSTLPPYLAVYGWKRTA